MAQPEGRARLRLPDAVRLREEGPHRRGRLAPVFRKVKVEQRGGIAGRLPQELRGQPRLGAVDGPVRVRLGVERAHSGPVMEGDAAGDGGERGPRDQKGSPVKVVVDPDEGGARAAPALDQVPVIPLELRVRPLAAVRGEEGHDVALDRERRRVLAPVVGVSGQPAVRVFLGHAAGDGIGEAEDKRGVIRPAAEVAQRRDRGQGAGGVVVADGVVDAERNRQPAGLTIEGPNGERGRVLDDRGVAQVGLPVVLARRGEVLPAPALGRQLGPAAEVLGPEDRREVVPVLEPRLQAVGRAPRQFRGRGFDPQIPVDEVRPEGAHPGLQAESGPPRHLAPKGPGMEPTGVSLPLEEPRGGGDHNLRAFGAQPEAACVHGVPDPVIAGRGRRGLGRPGHRSPDP